MRFNVGKKDMQQTSPTFSVILPTFNREKLVARAIDSVLLQDYQDFELIVIDDGSTDKTMEVLKRYKDLRLKIFKKENGGVSSARNLGLEYASGKYVTFVDSDDYFLQGFLKDAWGILSQNQVSGLFYSGFAIEDKKTREIPLFWGKEFFETKFFDHYEFFKDFCLFAGNSWACAKFFDRDAINAHHIRFSEDISYGEDLNFILQFLFFVPDIGLRDQRFYCYDVRHESLDRGQIDIDTQSENILKNHRKIANMLVLHQRKELFYCLNALTITHLYGRYFKKAREWRGKPSDWENEFLEICADPEQKLNFVQVIRKKCIMLKPPILGAVLWSICGRIFLVLAWIFKARKKILGFFSK